MGKYHSIPDKTFTIEVHPYIGFIPNLNPNFITFNEDEVKAVFHVPLHVLLDPQKRSYHNFRDTGQLVAVFDVGRTVKIWGLTAMILEDVLKSIIVSNMETNVNETLSKN